MRQLTSLDAQFLAVEDGRNLAQIASLAILDPSRRPGGFTVEVLRTLIAERLYLLPPFRWRLAEVPFGLDHPYWVDVGDVDLEFHVRELALPSPGDDRQLAAQVARIHGRPLDRSRPLWEVYLIHGVHGGRAAFLAKAHHAAVDGVSGAELMSVLLDPSPDGRELPEPSDSQAADRVPNGSELLARALLHLSFQPLRALRAAPGVLPNLDQVLMVRSLPGVEQLAAAARVATFGRHSEGNVLESSALRAPRTSFNRRIGMHRSFAFGSLALDDAKTVKDHFGTTVNDVIVAIAAGALRRRLEIRGELPDAPLLGMIPISVRAAQEQGSFGNQVSNMIVPLPTDEADPERRLLRVSEALRSSKERHRALPADLLRDANLFIPPALFARASRAVTALIVREPIRSPVNVVISNVPGPRLPLYCAGAEVKANFPASAIMDGVGLNISLLSYRDQIDVGIVGDRDLVPYAWELLDDLRSELAELVGRVTGAS